MPPPSTAEPSYEIDQYKSSEETIVSEKAPEVAAETGALQSEPGPVECVPPPVCVAEQGTAGTSDAGHIRFDQAALTRRLSAAAAAAALAEGAALDAAAVSSPQISLPLVKNDLPSPPAAVEGKNPSKESKGGCCTLS